MADTPTPRSIQQIEGDMFDAFIAKTGITSLKVGSPLRSLIEAVAQSQLQNSADIFQLLNSISLDRATGTALDSIAADEGIARRSASAAFGYVTFTDIGFTKVETILTQPAAVSDRQIVVKNATSFASTGNPVSITLNSGESNQETVVISSISGNTITLASNLQYSHATSAPVLKLQFGNRLIPAGTSIGGTVKFNTINQATISSGETTIENVPVLCATVGTSGNVAANSVTSVNSSLPFSASVTNPLPFANAVDAETDDELRQRIRIARQTRQRGTPLAIQNAVSGVVSADENKRVASASIMDVGQGKAVLYIDDGTGYEGKFSGIGLEVLVGFASGGEQFFELQGGRPVAKAFVQSGDTTPFNLRGGETLTVKVDGISETHTFAASDFAIPGKANVYEVVSSINAGLHKFIAMTSADKQKFIVTLREDSNSMIQVVDGGGVFGFSTSPSRTLYLFLDGELLAQGTDYTIDRNRGQIYLNSPLVQGQSLVAGSVDTRAVLKTEALPASYTAVSNESLFFVVDDPTASIVPVEIEANTVTIAAVSANTDLLSVTVSSAGFASVVAGDWMVVHDTAFTTPFIGKVTVKDSDSVVLVDATAASLPPNTYTLLQGGLTFVRTSSVPQKVAISTYSDIDVLVSSINANKALHAKAIYQNRLALSSNSYTDTGSIMFVGQRSSLNIGLSAGTMSTNLPDYNQSASSGTENAVPLFAHISAAGATSNVGAIAEFTLTEKSSIPLSGLSGQAGFTTTYQDTTTYSSTLNNSYSSTDYRVEAPGYHFSSSDVLNVVLDSSPSTSSYAVPMVYEAKIHLDGGNVFLQGADGETNTIKTAFNSANLTDYAIWRASDTATANTNTVAASNSSFIFKEKNFGPSTLLSKVEFDYPTQAGVPFSGSIDDSGKMSISLASSTQTTTVNSIDAFIYVRNKQSQKEIELLGWIPAKLWTNDPSKGTCVIIDIDSGGYEKFVLDAIPLSSKMLLVDTNHDPIIPFTLPYGFSSNPVATSTEYVFPFAPGSATVISGQDIRVCFSQSGVGVDFTSSLSPSGTKICVFESDLKTYNQVDYLLGAGGYRVKTSGSYVESITLSCSPISLGDGFVDLSATSSALSFVFLKTETLSNSNFTNAYVELAEPYPTSAITRSTADHFDFDPALIAANGVFSTASSAVFIKTCNTATYRVTTKSSATFSEGEAVQLVPVTAKNVTDKLNAYFQNLNVASTTVSYAGQGIEVARTVNPDGSLQVTGGSANSHEALSYGLNDASDAFKVTAGDLSGFAVGNMVKVESFAKKQISRSLEAAFDIFTTDEVSEITLQASVHGFFDLWSNNYTAPSTPYIAESKKWFVKKTGDLLCFTSIGNLSDNATDFATLVSGNVVAGTQVVIHRPKYKSTVYETVGSDKRLKINNFDLALSDIQEEDIVVCERISTGVKVEKMVVGVDADGIIVSNTTGISGGCYIYPKNDPTNLYGTYRVLGSYVNNTTKDVSFWVEAPADFTEGVFTLATKFMSKESAVTGDSLQFTADSTAVNVTVQELNLGFQQLASAYTQATKTIKTSVTGLLDGVYDTLGWKRTSSTVETAYAQLESATVGLNDTVNLKLANFNSYQWFAPSENTPVTITALNKLNFDTAEITSIRPGYNYYSGLIGESNKVVYGDMQDPVNYPGYAAANAVIEVLPPMVKRIFLSLVLRMSGGFSTPDTLNAVRSAVSSAVISTPVGTSVSFSDIIQQVNQVPGVFAVSVSQPPFAAPNNLNTTSDIIPVSAGEKAFVVYPEQDIQIKILGA